MDLATVLIVESFIIVYYCPTLRHGPMVVVYAASLASYCEPQTITLFYYIKFATSPNVNTRETLYATCAWQFCGFSLSRGQANVGHTY
jgi:hypothetical protein